MRKISESPSLVDLRLLANYLENEGIEVAILNEHQGGSPGVPHWALSVWAELWVTNSRQFDEASRLVARYQHELSHNTGDEWTCPSCSEPNPANFDSCWKCGHVGRRTPT